HWGEINGYINRTRLIATAFYCFCAGICAGGSLRTSLNELFVLSALVLAPSTSTYAKAQKDYVFKLGRKRIINGYF
ncbi:hypothetical protein, partial [Campylobacter sp.]|uniref:hypothetical protein n=1 Tax=Campylobacter sp. TaxID=205 RepID=UPI002AA85FED